MTRVTNKFNPWLHEYYARYGSGLASAADNSLLFLIGSADISGGTYVIFEHAMYAHHHGVDVTIVPLFPLDVAAKDWHPALSELRFATLAEIRHEKFDVAIATWWPTVLHLPEIRFRHAIYFIQSIESRFYAQGPDRGQAGLAELTYTMGLPVITIATWIQAYLAFEHEAPSFIARNGIDKSRYGPDGVTVSPRKPGRLRVLVEGALESEMKQVDRCLLLAKEAGADEVWLLTPSPVTQRANADRVFSRVPATRTAEIYRSCDVLLKLSQVEGMFGPPLEMFHCGGTVVCNDVTGAEEYVVDDLNGIVVPTDDDEATKAALAALRSDPALLDRLQRGARATADAWPDWEASSRTFLHLVKLIASQPPRDLVKVMAMAAGARALHLEVSRGD